MKLDVRAPVDAMTRKNTNGDLELRRSQKLSALVTVPHNVYLMKFCALAN
jgi:hypothetical protein